MPVKEILKRIHFEKFMYRVHESFEKRECVLVIHFFTSDTYYNAESTKSQQKITKNFAFGIDK